MTIELEMPSLPPMLDLQRQIRQTVPVDFRELLFDLRRSGMTGAAIERLSGVSRGALCAYMANRSRPKHRTGEALIALWCLWMKRPRDEAPRVAGRCLSASRVAREERGPVDVFQSPTTAAAAVDLAAVSGLWASRSTA